MAPNTLTACTWYLDMGADTLKGKRLENSLHLTLEYGSREVTIVYFKGIHGAEHREHMPVHEALEWLNKIQREWAEFGSQIGNKIDWLRKYQY